MASKYYWCPVCTKQYITREYATRCHGIDPVTKRPEPEKPLPVPKPRPISKMSVGIDRATKRDKALVAVGTLLPDGKVRIVVSVALPDPNCPKCAIARKFGTVLRCQCMTKM